MTGSALTRWTLHVRAGGCNRGGSLREGVGTGSALAGSWRMTGSAPQTLNVAYIPSLIFEVLLAEIMSPSSLSTAYLITFENKGSLITFSIPQKRYYRVNDFSNKTFSALIRKICSKYVLIKYASWLVI